MSIKRSLILLIIINILFFALIIRIFFIQIIDKDKIFKEASMQKVANITLEKIRGDICDRTGIPLTNRTIKYEILLTPELFKTSHKNQNSLFEILKIDKNKILTELKNYNYPILLPIDEKNKELLINLEITGISFVNSLNRYDIDTVSKHVLGYINKLDNQGEIGIEKFYQKILNIHQTKFVGGFFDARNNLIKGLGYRIFVENGDTKKKNIKLTLDYKIQKAVENIFIKNNITGASIVSDITNGNILAILSHPDFDQNNVLKYLHSPKKELLNRAVASYNLGSIFKIIDVAALLEENPNFNNNYYCNGFFKLGNKKLRCMSYESGGHGTVNLKEGFSKSCNSYFINLGLYLGFEKINKMCEKFGLGSKTGLNEQGIDETSGNIYCLKKVPTVGDLANISIGQGDILATPLQVLSIINTIANDGVKNKLNIVDSIVDENNNILKKIAAQRSERVIKINTAMILKDLMKEVVISGTGKKANYYEYNNMAGKTGSAETGQFLNGEKVVHAWFAGFFPIDTPKYSIVIFVENGKSGANAAAPIFAEIQKGILEAQ